MKLLDLSVKMQSMLLSILRRMSTYFAGSAETINSVFGPQGVEILAWCHTSPLNAFFNLHFSVRKTLFCYCATGRNESIPIHATTRLHKRERNEKGSGSTAVFSACLETTKGKEVEMKDGALKLM